MSFDRKSFDRAVEESGLTKMEMARIFNTSRQNIYNIMGGATPIPVHAERIGIYSKGILKLVQLGILPLPSQVAGQKRTDAIGQLVKKLYEIAKPE